jgi:hypothetical protein
MRISRTALKSFKIYFSCMKTIPSNGKYRNTTLEKLETNVEKPKAREHNLPGSYYHNYYVNF